MPYQLMFLRAPRFDNSNWLDPTARKTAKIVYEDGEEQEDIDLPDSAATLSTNPTYLAGQKNASIATSISSIQSKRQGKSKETAPPPETRSESSAPFTSSPLAQARYSHTYTSTPPTQLQADKQLAQEIEKALLHEDAIEREAEGLEEEEKTDDENN